MQNSDYGIATKSEIIAQGDTFWIALKAVRCYKRLAAFYSLVKMINDAVMAIVKLFIYPLVDS